MSVARPANRDGFEIAIICALPLEFNAVYLTFDEFWDENGDQYNKAEGDLNTYTTGRIGKYNVVLVLLAGMGKVNAATAAAGVSSSYRSLRLALLVGVCGGVPFYGDTPDVLAKRRSRYSVGPTHTDADDVGEILLGDVIISDSVVQYDFGRKYSDKFTRKNTAQDNLGRPNRDIRTFLNRFKTDSGIDQIVDRTAQILQEIQNKTAKTKRRGKYNYPGTAHDRLYVSAYRHKHHNESQCICRNCLSDSDPVCDAALKLSCAELACGDDHLVVRTELHRRRELEPDDRGKAQQPSVHIGAVASGDMVLKSAADRDKIADEASVIAFEMEGAGIWDEVPCIVVKGVCDYADSHKQKNWQEFAAATAASASKAVLERYIQTDKVANTPANINNEPNRVLRSHNK